MREVHKNPFISARRIISRLFQWAEKNGDRLVFVPIIVYTIIFSVYTCYMNYVFKTFAWDLGIFVQSLWTTLHSGKIMFSTLEVPYGNPSGIFFGVHFSPILFLVLPVYAIFQTPETLLVFQSFILALAALPLYWIARDKLDKRLYGLAFAVGYLLNPALSGVNTFDFHVEIFTPLFLLFAFYYLDKGKWLKAIPFIALELTTIEFAPILVFFLGFYFFLRKILEQQSKRTQVTNFLKKLIAPLTIMVVSVFCLFLAFYVISAVNPLKTGGPAGAWKYWGTNISEVATNIVRNPANALIILATPLDKPYFLIFLLGSTVLLPLFALPELFLWMPWLIAAFLTDYQPYYQPYYQYSALFLGQLFIAAVFGFSKLFHSEEKRSGKNGTRRKIIAAILVVNACLFLAMGPGGIPAFTNRGIKPYSISTSQDPNHIAELYKLLSFIPANASVATLQNIFPHVCQRLNAYILKWPLDYEVDYILVDVESSTYTWSIYGPKPSDIVITLLNSSQYGVLAISNGVMLFKRGYTGPLQYFTPQRETFNSDELNLASGIIAWDYSSDSTRTISTNPNNSIGFIWFGPYQYFVPGNYSATFKMKTATENCQLQLDVAANLGSTVIAAQTLNGTMFHKLNAWQNFTIHFKLAVPESLEFRGYCFTNNTQVELDFIRVEQSSLP